MHPGPEAGQFCLHRFSSHQPDLNIANPAVRDELAQIMGFWLAQGLSGFRVDAVPCLVEPMGLPEGAIADPHGLLRDLRSFLSRRSRSPTPSPLASANERGSICRTTASCHHGRLTTRARPSLRCALAPR